MYSFCGLKNATSYNLNPFKTQTRVIKKKISGLNPDTVYLFNVVAEDPNGKQIMYRFETFKTYKHSPVKAKGFSIGVALGISIPFVIVTIIIILCLMMKNKRLTEELEIEMHDVPARALKKAVAGPPSLGRRNRPYSSLLTRSPDADDDDEEFLQNDVGFYRT